MKIVSLSISIRLGIYQHYRGKLYHVLGIARHEQTLEELVIYRALYGDYGIWARAKDVFFEQVSDAGVMVPRFRFVAETGVCAPLVEELA